MNVAPLIIGIVPLVAFVIVDGLAGLKAALVSTVVLTLFEVGASLYLFGEIDSVTWLSLGLVLILALLSYQRKADIYIKFQPVALSGALGLIMLVSFFIDRSLLLTVALKYQQQLPLVLQRQLALPIFQKMLHYGTLNMGIAMLFHGAATAWAALKLSNWWWLAIRGVGFYVFAFIGF